VQNSTRNFLFVGGITFPPGPVIGPLWVPVWMAIVHVQSPWPNIVRYGRFPTRLSGNVLKYSIASR